MPEAAESPSVNPWAVRQDRGTVRAFLETVWSVVRRPRRLYALAAHPRLRHAPQLVSGFLPLAFSIVAGLCGVGCRWATADEVPEGELLAQALELRSGSVLADVGAGDGRWSEMLARRVGESGRVYATEVAADDLRSIRRRIERQGLDNVTLIEGDQRHTGLPPACCDAVLLRMVYHHFEDPGAMRADLRRALRPGGLLVIVDISPQRHWRTLRGVPDRGGHGIELDELVAELAGDGFELIRAVGDWPGEEDRYAAIFRRP